MQLRRLHSVWHCKPYRSVATNSCSTVKQSMYISRINKDLCKRLLDILMVLLRKLTDYYITK